MDYRLRGKSYVFGALAPTVGAAFSIYYGGPTFAS